MADHVQLRKSRTGTKHSRNGCITCKIRRIKCDETKPECRKCVGTGRRCDGYVTQRPVNAAPAAPICPKPTSSMNFQNPFLDFAGTKIEHRFFAFFRDYTVPVMSGFDYDFWGELLPRVSQSEPAIQHAMIAVAAAHARVESMLELADGIDQQEECQQFQLQQYTKAIRCLRIRLLEDGASQEVTLLSCFLLIALEFLEGNIEQGILHLQGGLPIFESYSRRVKNSPSASDHDKWLARKLKDMFYRFRGQAMLAGRLVNLDEEVQVNPNAVFIKKKFSDFGDARSCLDRLLTATFGFIHSAIKSHYRAPSTAEGKGITMETLIETGLALSAKLRQWSESFESFVAQYASVNDDKLFNGITMLRMFYIISSIWLSACASPSETAFDTKLQEFSSLIELAASMKHRSSAGTGSNSSRRANAFTIDMGAIAPLYFVIIACRDQRLRRQAISLLHTYTPRREGLWDASIVEYVGRCVMHTEESLIHELAVHSADPTLEREKLMPGEQERIVDITIHPKYDPDNRQRKMFTVTYMMKDSEGKGWLFREEDVVLGSDGIYRPSRETTYTKSLEEGTTRVATAFKLS